MGFGLPICACTCSLHAEIIHPAADVLVPQFTPAHPIYFDKLEDRAHNPLPKALLYCNNFRIIGIEVDLTHAALQIHVDGPPEQTALASRPDFPEKIQRNDDRCGQELLEEILCVR